MGRPIGFSMLAQGAPICIERCVNRVPLPMDDLLALSAVAAAPGPGPDPARRKHRRTHGQQPIRFSTSGTKMTSRRFCVCGVREVETICVED